MAGIDTSWVAAGAKVVVYRQDRDWRTRPRVHLTTVAKVAAKSFTVDGLDERIRLDTLKSKSYGGKWDQWEWVALHPDSELSADLLAIQRLNRLANLAHQAVVDWNTGKDRRDVEKVDAVITAFRRFRSALGIQEGGSE